MQPLSSCIHEAIAGGFMKKNSLKKLAFLGLASGLLAAQQADAKQIKEAVSYLAANSQSIPDDPNGNLGYHLMTEDELLLELNEEGTNLYKSLSPEGKQLAREVASMRCNGTNKCEGLNACRTDDNECAGKGSCEGKGKCAISDKNFAVKLVAEKMAKKRANATHSNK